MQRSFIWIVLAASAVWAQQPETGAPPRERSLRGFVIHEAGVLGQYYTTGIAERWVALAPFSQSLRSDAMIGGVISAGYVVTGERTRFAITYTPSYLTRVRYSELNSFNQALALNVNRDLSMRTRMYFTFNTMLRSTEAFMFNPSELSTVASSPGTVTDLSQTMADGTSRDAQVASMLTGSPDADSAGQLLLYGTRVMVSTAYTQLSHMVTPRLTLSAAFNARHREGFGRDQGIFNRTTPVLDRATAGGATIALSYAASPRTTVSVSGQSTRQHTLLERRYTTLIRGSIQRMLSPSWFVSLTGGSGNVTANELQPLSTLNYGYIAGGALGYRFRAHTFLGSYQRQIGDIYGAGSDASSNVSLAWNHQRPGSRWRLSAGGTQQDLSGGTIPFTAWRGHAQVDRRVGRQVTWTFQYAYIAYTNAGSTQPSLSQSAIRMAIMWTPHQLQ